MRNLRGFALPSILIIASSALIQVVHGQELAKDGKRSTPSYVVVMKNGQRLPARTKPVIAFGKVRYMEPGGTNRVLPASKIDIDTTRAANAKEPSKTTGGTLSVGGGMADFKPSTSSGVEKTRSKSVKVYSATWCPYCTKLKKFLAEKNISASITEVDRLPEAAQQKAHAEMRRLTGRVSYPTVVIGNSAVAGFSPQWILKSLKN